MRDRIVITAVLALVAACPAFGQALAEGAMVHAGAAGATAKAGTALGNALSRTTGQIGQQMQTVTHPALGSGTVQTVHSVPTSGQSAHPTTVNSISGSGSMIASIRGARISCSPAPTNSTASVNSSPAGSPQPSQGCKAPTMQENQPKSVVSAKLPK